MADEGFKRKLTAILSADVEGYSRLMADDEAATVRTLSAYKEIIITLVRQNRGQVVDSPGDNLLAEFASVVDAVQCAVAVQKELSIRNSALSEERRMLFRIGVNLGDVIEEGDSIYGDGVNIAARLESLSDPGGICISKTAFDHIESKLPYGYEFMGDQEVKNIPKPVKAYRVLMDPRVTVAGAQVPQESQVGKRKWTLVAVAVIVLVAGVLIWQFYNNRVPTESTSADIKTSTSSEKPSLAVMPFNNMSGDPDLDYVCDGLSENIITALSKIPDFFVIARNSTFFYKDKPVNISQVGHELGVRYILEGSVLKSGEQVRINAQLIDVSTGHHIWSETYDKQWTDFLSILDEITLAVARSLNAKIFTGTELISTNNLDAWLLIRKAGHHINRLTKEDNAIAINLAKQAAEIDPNYGEAYLLIANSLMLSANRRWAASPKEAMNQAEEMVFKTLEIDDKSGFAHNTLCELHLYQRKYDDALVECQKGVDLDPNADWGYFRLARCLLFAGQPKNGLPIIKEAMRLNPHYPWGFLSVSGRIYYHTGRYEEALDEFEKAFQICSRGDCSMYFPHIYLAMVYGKLGREKEAREHMEKVLEINPRFNLEARRRVSLFKNKEDTDREIEALRKACAPEKPPAK